MTLDMGRVGVIAGGLSHEREISLESGRELTVALHSEGVEASLYEPDSLLFDQLLRDSVGVCYMALHGAGGEDGSIQEVLEFLDIPFAGSSSAACKRGWDKVVARANLERLDIEMPAWCSLPGARIREIGLERLEHRLADIMGFPMVVKPSGGGSAHGLAVVRDGEELKTAIPRTLAYGDRIIFEKVVAGREIHICVYDDEDGLSALPPVELLIDDEERFDYAARHDPSRIGYSDCGGLEVEAIEKAVAAAKSAHRGLGLRDLSRADFILDERGRLTLLEVSLSPGLYRASSLSASLRYADMSLGAFVGRLLRKRVVNRSFSLLIREDEEPPR
jgi:D-alanine-D-alanine ligase